MDDIEESKLISIPFNSLQGFRPIYRNQPISGSTLSQEIIYIAPKFDPEYGLYVIFFEDILKHFKNAIRVRNGKSSILFVTDRNRENKFPLRINIAIGRVLDVIIENPIEDLSESSLPLQPSDTVSINEMGLSSFNQISSSSASRSPFLDPRPIENSTFEKLLRTQDPTQGIGLTVKKANEGDDLSQADLATIYIVFHMNYDKGMEWYYKSADQGNPIAMYSIGYMHMSGFGPFQRDDEKAKEWLFKAAEKEYTSAYSALGILYQEGRAVPRNHKLAAEWYRIAEKDGCSVAPMNIGVLYQRGLEGVKGYADAVKFFLESAERGNTLAQTYVAAVYRIGCHKTKASLAKSELWFLLAANQGQPYAQSRLIDLYQKMGKLDSALKWERISAEQGNAKLQYSLGISLSAGNGTPHNFPEAIKWLRLALEGEDLRALTCLGMIYGSGYGVPKNLWMAKDLYVKYVNAVKADPRIASVRLLELKRIEKKQIVYHNQSFE